MATHAVVQGFESVAADRDRVDPGRAGVKPASPEGQGVRRDGSPQANTAGMFKNLG
jgi:hypothetical protein